MMLPPLGARKKKTPIPATTVAKDGRSSHVVPPCFTQWTFKRGNGRTARIGSFPIISGADSKTHPAAFHLIAALLEDGRPVLFSFINNFNDIN